MIRCNLERILTQRRISQRELARRTGLHRQTIRRLRQNEWTTLSREVLEALCASLHITPQQLLDWKEDN